MLMNLNPSLTVRQQEIAAAVLEGATNRQIAVRLHISEQTVKNQLWKIYAKIGVANRLQLAVWALRGADPPSSPPTTNLSGSAS